MLLGSLRDDRLVSRLDSGGLTPSLKPPAVESRALAAIPVPAHAGKLPAGLCRLSTAADPPIELHQLSGSAALTQLATRYFSHSLRVDKPRAFKTIACSFRLVPNMSFSVS